MAAGRRQSAQGGRTVIAEQPTVIEDHQAAPLQTELDR
jgi:hypothetical protein